jgi:two-component system response regulator DesR
MPEAEPTTLVVDGHPVVRKGQADSVASAKAVAVAERPGLAVVDIRLPDGDGIEVVAALGTLVPQCRCLMLTMEANPSLVRRAMDAGNTH